MTGSRSGTTFFSGVAALSVVVVAGVADGGCGSRKSASALGGAVSLGLKLAGGAQINTVDYQISGNGVAPINGSIDVAKFNTVSELVTGIPAGKGYAVELAADSADAKVHCAGSAMFDVALGKTTQANVVMQCSDSSPVGGVTITGTFDNCPVVSSHTASPMAAPLGGTIMLSAKGSDLDGDTLSFEWSESDMLGRFEEVKKVDNRTATVVFTCGFTGQTLISVTTSDGTCGDMGDIPVICGNFTPDGGVDGNAGGGGRQGTGSGGSIGSSGGLTGSTASGGTFGSGGAPASSGGAIGSGGAGTGTGGAGTGTGTGGAGGGNPGGMGGAPAASGGAGGAAVCTATNCKNAACQACVFGGDEACALTQVEECGACIPPYGDGDCSTLAAAGDRKLCEDVYSCFIKSNCIKMGDPLKCWCGTHPTTCVTADSGPDRADGVCLPYVFAAAKTMVAADIKTAFTKPESPLGRAALLVQCQGLFCSTPCAIP